jgi:predicted secreted Zn-dependent protease
MKGVFMPSHISASGDLDWHVSRTCDNGQCIKVARAGKFVMIGNTTKPEGPVGEFTVEEWRHFLAGVRLGDFDGIA